MGMTVSKESAHKYVKIAAGAITVLVGVTTALNVSSGKYISGNSSYTAKGAVMLSRLIGPQATVMLFPGQTVPGVGGVGSLPGQGITPFGIFNTSTWGGIAALVINAVVRYFNIPYYNSYISPFINAFGIGSLVGGVAGGLLDPDASQASGGSGFLPVPSGPQFPQISLTSQAQGSLPFLSVAGVRLHGTARR